MKIHYYENSLNENYKVFEFRKGIKIASIIKKIGYVKGNYVILVGDDVYNYPKDKDVKLYCDFATIKLCYNGKSNILNSLLVVAGTVLTIVSNGALYSIGTSLIVAGISGFLTQLFVKSSNSPEYDTANTMKYGVSGVSNQSNLGNCYPVILGRSIITPPYVGNYYTTLSDNTGDGKQYLTVLLNAGYGELSLKNFKVGENLVAKNEDDIRNGEVKIDGNFNATIQINQDGNLPSIYSRKYFQEQLGNKIEYSNTPSDIRTSPKKVNKIRLYIKFNALYRQNKNNGNLEKTTVQLQVGYKPTNSETWSFSDSTLTHNITEQTIRTGVYFKTIKIYNQKVQGYNFKLNTSDGLKNGKYYNNKVYINVSGDDKELQSSTKSFLTYTGNENKTKRFYIDINLTEEEIANNPSMQWDFSVWKLTKDGDSYTQNFPYLESVLYFIDEEPVIESERKKLCLVAFRIEASEFIQNVIDKINFEAQSILPVWNGTDWNTRLPSSNPASAYLQCIKGKYLNKVATDDQIDYENFVKLYEFCEKNKYYCNGVISNSETLRDIITKILNTCRSEFSIKNGMYSVVIDDVRDSPVAILSPKNSSNFQFTKDLSNKVNAIKVKYQNADDNWETIEEEVRLKGEEPSADDNIISVDYWGVDNHEQAVKLCRYAIATSRLRPETYSLKVSIEHFSLPKGSRVELQHDVLLIGVQSGYIKAVDGKTITLDELLPIQEIGKEYGLKVVSKNSDNILVLPVENFNGQTRQVILKDDIVLSKGDFYAYGEIGKITEDCIIIDKTIDESPQLSATLTLKSYSPAIFNSDTDEVPEYDSKITKPSSFLTNLIYEGSKSEVDTSGNGSSIQDDGGIFYNIGNANIDAINNIVKNLGNLASYGNAEYTCDFINNFNFTWFKGGVDKYVKFKVDNSMYKSFTISFYLYCQSSQDKKIVCSYKDTINNNIFEIYTEDNSLFVEHQGAKIPMEIDLSIPNMLSFVKDYDRGIFKIYVNGIYLKQLNINNINANYITEDSSSLFIDEDSVNSFITESYSVPIISNDRDIYFYLFRDVDGNYISDYQITEFHLWKDVLEDSDIKRLNEEGYYIVNTPAESRYLGEFPIIPETGNLYDYFFYTGETNINFLQNHYYRKIKSGWELIKFILKV